METGNFLAASMPPGNVTVSVLRASPLSDSVTPIVACVTRVRPTHAERTLVHRPMTMMSAVWASARFESAATVVASARIVPRSSIAMRPASLGQPFAWPGVHFIGTSLARLVEEVIKGGAGGDGE